MISGRTSRAARLTCALVSLGLTSLATSQALADEASTPDHWRVIWLEQPATQAWVAWTTRVPGQRHVVHFGEQPVRPQGGQGGQGGIEAYPQRVEVATTGRYTASDEAYYHHVNLSSLKPSTTYYFTIETDGQLSPELRFVTAPDDDRPVRILYGGDSRSDAADRQLMNRRVASLVEQDDSLLALVHGGDYIDEGYSWEQWREWLDDHELTITDSGRILPIVPARGNHERDGVIYNHVFADPGGMGAQRNYWTTQLGPMVKLLNLDSSDSAAGDQRLWLERELIRAQTSRWIIANYHIPAYPAVKIAGPAKLYWVPLFEQYKVDLVCESDGHVLKRTVPILNDKEDPEGVVYVGEGGMGVKQRTPATDRWFLKAPGMAMSGHHVQIITFTRDRLSYQAILQDGSVADEYHRSPRPTRMLDPFLVDRAQRGGPAGIDLRFSHTPDLDTLTPDSVQIDQGARITSMAMRPDAVTLRVQVEGLTPGVEYSLSLGEIRDMSGRTLSSRVVTFRMPGEAPGTPPDMGAPEPDLGGDPPDMAPEVDLGQPSAGSASGGASEEGGCSAASTSAARRAAPLGFVLFFGALWAWRRRRRATA